MIDFGEYIVVCPVSDEHTIDVQDMVCRECGSEAVSMSEDEFMGGAI